jgi:hypothetical protein
MRYVMNRILFAGEEKAAHHIPVQLMPRKVKLSNRLRIEIFNNYQQCGTLLLGVLYFTLYT